MGEKERREGVQREVEKSFVSKEPTDDWVAAASVMRQTGRKEFGVTSGQVEDNKDTW